MTRRELNSAIRKLNNDITKVIKKEDELGNKYDSFKERFKKLWIEDQRWEYMTVLSIKIMVILNRKYGFVDASEFISYIEIK